MFKKIKHGCINLGFNKGWAMLLSSINSLPIPPEHTLQMYIWRYIHICAYICKNIFIVHCDLAHRERAWALGYLYEIVMALSCNGLPKVKRTESLKSNNAPSYAADNSSGNHGKKLYYYLILLFLWRHMALQKVKLESCCSTQKQTTAF